MSMFYIGQCVTPVREASAAARKQAARIGASFPIYGVVYTIRAIVFETRTGETVLLFEEILNPVLRGESLERGFRAVHFRPVKPTSIEVFRQLLSPIHERETV